MALTQVASPVAVPAHPRWHRLCASCVNTTWEGIMRTIGAIALALGLSLPSIAFGWSSPGHKTVCQIALLELEKSAPDAHAKVVEILSKEPASSGFR